MDRSLREVVGMSSSEVHVAKHGPKEYVQSEIYCEGTKMQRVSVNSKVLILFSIFHL